MIGDRSLSDWRRSVSQARERIGAFVIPTPLVPVPTLSRAWGREVYVKLENLQHTGSFKIRGAASRMTLLSARERALGVVACSSGNHGRAVSHVARKLGIDAVICVPAWVDPVKADAIGASGARIVDEAASYDEADRLAREIATSEGRTFIHPFDDPEVIAGQGTLGLEILEQCPEVADVALALSGGGLVAGVGVACAGAGGTGPNVIAVSAQRARVMWESLRAGTPIVMEEEETLAGALLGGIDLDNRYTLALVRHLISDHVLVTEHEIADAMRLTYSALRCVVEGAGAVPLAALLAGKLTDHPRRDPTRPPEGAQGPLVIVLAGGNVDPAVLKSVVAGAIRP
jgi:threonine dehydratase